MNKLIYKSCSKIQNSDYDFMFSIKDIFIKSNDAILISAILSSLIYEYDKCYFNDLIHAYNIQNYIVNKNHDVIYGIFNIKGISFLVFKGTSDLTDVFEDVNIQLIDSDFSPGKIHYGFNDLFINVISGIVIDLQNIKSNTFKTIITGHSLGAAIATLMYSFIKNKNFIIDKFNLITFGSPKCGDKKFVNFINSSDITRIINKKDIITWLPCSWLPFNYRHTNFKLVIEKSKKGWGIFDINDHKINNYIKYLL